uniref:Uncharacterized protein n=1 Tax=uncultured Chloroflexi bacterium HF0200_09I09 TaxID=710736 RepID=E0XU72_9CHLR|nr:hypothetical protein [uncultured Chloroflexi bacterium HF0200_09I09]
MWLPNRGLYWSGSSRDGAVVARRAHNPKVGGSNPSPATKPNQQCCLPFVIRVNKRPPS